MNRQLSKIIALIGVCLLAVTGCQQTGENKKATAKDSTNAVSTEKHPVITHGPILGGSSPNSMLVWVRTSEPSKFIVTVRSDSDQYDYAEVGKTSLQRDNTGWVKVRGLRPNTKYRYSVKIPSYAETEVFSSFRTLPSEDSFRNNAHNPNGLFNFSFEFGCGNYQNPKIHSGPLMPTYETMLKEISDKVNFQIMNGDFIYEAKRRTTVDEWQSSNNISAMDIPALVETVPGIVGVWENYKHYMDNAPNLRLWHQKVPAFFVIDDHEILNDINGSGTPGTQKKPAVFRDIGVQAWRDYVGWSNPYPVENQGDMWFGTGTVQSGENVLIDESQDFTQLDLNIYTNLTIHWNDKHAGRGVYEITGIEGPHKIKISPVPTVDGRNLSYSIGKQNYFKFRVSNCEFFVLDTRTLRDQHDIDNPWKADISMIGERQRKWLQQSMRESDAEFMFVVSSVNFTVPHVSPRQPDKDEAWTAFMSERQELFTFWKSLDAPVFLLSGDLHNSMAIHIDEDLWEFAAGPHNSPNHYAMEEGGRPAAGKFTYHGETVNIRWSSFFLDDVPRKYLRQPYYCLVEVKNVFLNPTGENENRFVAYDQAHVIFQFYDGLTGELAYAETITGKN